MYPQLSSPSLAGLVDEVTRALCNYLTQCSEVLPKESRWIEVSADDPDTLIGNWTDELLLIFQNEGTLFKDSATRLEERPGSRYHLRSHLWGEPFDPACHLLCHDIPARPVRRPRVRRHGDGWRAELELVPPPEAAVPSGQGSGMISGD